MFKKLKQWRDAVRMMMLDKSLPPPNVRELALIEDLKATFRSYSPMEKESAPPSEMEWISNLNRLRDLVLANDPREFLRWDVIRKTMFVSSWPYLEKELSFLKNRADWDSRWLDAIKESDTGHPPPYLSWPDTSGNLIHHAYHIAQFEEKTGRRVHEMDCVLEFGGGYGSMCRLFHNLGFKGKYLIFDFPFFSSLQQFFLKSIGIQVCSEDVFRSSSKGVFCFSDISKFNAYASDLVIGNSMFVATWSISETPIDLRNSLLPMIAHFNNILIGYQHEFGEVDNSMYFKGWCKVYEKHIRWMTWPIEHLPGNHYLLGVLKT